MWSELARYLAFPFVQNALIVGVLIALCASLLGVVLVLKRFSYIGDGLSHVAFGAMALASVMGLASQRMYVVLPITVIVALLLLKTGESQSRVANDAKIAMLSAGSLAIGYLLMNVFPTSGNVSGDVCTTLFGSTSILTLTKGEVWLCVALSALVLFVFALLRQKIFALTFDEDFARSMGLNVDMYNLLVAVIIAVIIVLAMNLVGSLLISALVIFPALSAMQVAKSFHRVLVVSAILSVACALFGMLFAILMDTPVGSTIVAADMLAFGACYFAGRLK